MDDPSCAGLPVLVGGEGARSVVCAASYEARAFGCRSAMPMGEARRRCPSAIIRPVRMRRYQELSDVFMDVLGSFSPLVESLSLDEAFVDLSGTQRLFGAPADTVVQIVARVREATGLNCSIGLAPSKFVAKIASDLRKPRGVVIVDSDGLMQFLAPLDIGRMWGVGPVAEERFRRQGYATFADLQRVSEAKVLEILVMRGDTRGNLRKELTRAMLFQSEHPKVLVKRKHSRRTRSISIDFGRCCLVRLKASRFDFASRGLPRAASH